MQFIDKAMNRALKWENVDVTIPEMIDLIQTEILEKVSDKELAELKKGMQKTFVLIVGHGSSRRFYPSSGASVRLCLDFNVLTHQLQRISLQDAVNKKEYFIPTGKASCTKLQSGVLRRMTQPDHGRKGIEQKPSYSGRYSDKAPERQNKIAYCKYCGKKIEDDAKFCSACGKAQGGKTVKENASASPRNENFSEPRYSPPHRTGNGGRFQRKRSSQSLPVLGVICAVLLVTALAFGGYQVWTHFAGSSDSKYITMVQNGYLGNVTDINVMEFFDAHYGAVGYEKGAWSGGETDSGHHIVELQYPAMDEIREDIRIQFRVLEDGCFRINYINHYLLESKIDSDLYCILNYICYMQHLQSNPQIAGDVLQEYGYIAALNAIPCYIYRYGAPVDYSGDRNELYQKFGDTALDISAAMLLDRYELLDMSYYYPNSSEAETEPVVETTPPETAVPTTIPATDPPTAPASQPTSSTEPSASQTELVGYVIESSGGLNVRNGPGVDYEQVGRLAPNEKVVILNTQQVGQYTWGKIYNGWIRMDYITYEKPTSSTVSSSPKTGYVLESSGGLKIRNGPGRDYAEIGRLAPNDQITVYEFTVIGTSNWGRIGEGQWICTDYVVFSDNAMYSTNSLSFNSIPKEYTFTSGAGGWGTNLTIANDGSFTGNYHDSEMGDVGEGYPSGTIYYCNFSGKFSTPIKVNDYTYKMKLETFAVADVEGYEYIQNEIRYIASGPYGFDWFNEYYIYFPGIPSSMMPHSVSEWLSRYNGYDMDAYKMYVICSAKGELPFVGMQD